MTTTTHTQPTPTPRPRRSPDLLATLSARLTPRDRWLLRMIHEHRVFTTAQLARLAFGTDGAARHRLLVLHRLRALDRFRPFTTTGSAPWHWILDHTGAEVLAAEHDLTAAQIGYRRDRALAVAHSRQLAHTIGANDVFTALAAHARHTPGSTLTMWWSAARCARLWGEHVRPDGYGRWRHHTTEIDFFVEYDTGAETLDRVAAKLHAYAALTNATGIATPVLFWLHSPHHEAALHHLITHPPVPAVTATGDPTITNPADAIWRPAGHHDTHRVALTELFPSTRPDRSHRQVDPAPSPTRPHLHDAQHRREEPDQP